MDTSNGSDEVGLHLVDPASYAKRGYPHVDWARLRREAPVERFHPPGWPAFWAITKHSDIREISKQPAIFINGEGMTIVADRVAEERGAMAFETIINMDPPKHRRYRAVASPFFTPRAL